MKMLATLMLITLATVTLGISVVWMSDTIAAACSSEDCEQIP